MDYKLCDFCSYFTILTLALFDTSQASRFTANSMKVTRSCPEDSLKYVLLDSDNYCEGMGNITCSLSDKVNAGTELLFTINVEDVDILSRTPEGGGSSIDFPVKDFNVDLQGKMMTCIITATKIVSGDERCMMWEKTSREFWLPPIESPMCVIEDRCHKPFGKSGSDPCLICDPEVSRVSWSRSADPDCSDESDDTTPVVIIIVGLVCACLFVFAVVAAVRARKGGIAIIVPRPATYMSTSKSNHVKKPYKKGILLYENFERFCRRRPIVNVNQGNLGLHCNGRSRLAFPNEAYMHRGQRSAFTQRF